MTQRRKTPLFLVLSGVVLVVVALLFVSLLTNVPNLKKKNDVRKSADLALKDGTRQYEKGNFARAIEEFQNLVSQKPKDPIAHYKLGMAYQGAGKLDKAIVEYKKAIKLDSKMTEAYYQLGISYRSKGKDKAAYEALEECVSQAPDLGGARLILAQMYTKDNQIDKAISQYKLLLELKLYGMNLADIHNELGLLYVKKGDIEKARSEWNSSLAIDPENVRAKELLSKY